MKRRLSQTIWHVSIGDFSYQDQLDCMRFLFRQCSCKQLTLIEEKLISRWTEA